MNRLKELRNESDLSLKELSKYVGIGETTLNLIENDKRAFKQEHIEKLAYFFNVSTDYLLCKSERGIIIDSDSVLMEITRKELRGLRQRNLIKNHIGIITDKYCVIRETHAYNLNDDKTSELRDTYISYYDEMTAEQVRKTIKFIDEYIKK